MTNEAENHFHDPEPKPEYSFLFVLNRQKIWPKFNGPRCSFGLENKLTSTLTYDKLCYISHTQDKKELLSILSSSATIKVLFFNESRRNVFVFIL